MSPSSSDDEVTYWMKRIAAIHGGAQLVHSENGRQIRFPSPFALEEDGIIELKKMHAYLNIDVYMGLRSPKVKGKRAGDKDLCGYCLKYRKALRMSRLLNMKPIAQRGYTVKTPKLSVVEGEDDLLVDDGNGNLIPPPPGDTVSILDSSIVMNANHPARVYLADRRFVPMDLHRFCKARWCVKEAPENPSKGMFYRRMPGGWKDTPQGRIIFPCTKDGVSIGWQARVIDKVIDNLKFHWHPYEERWVPTHERVPDPEKGSKWQLLPGLTRGNFEFSPSKYRNARGSKRNSLLMGLDEAVKWNSTRLSEKHGTSVGVDYFSDQTMLHEAHAVLLEGPMDAARLGPPSIAVLGAFLSDTQADMIAKRFGNVIVVRDEDRAGRALEESIATKLVERNVKVTMHHLPENSAAKDLGDLTPEVASKFRKEILP